MDWNNYICTVIVVNIDLKANIKKTYMRNRKKYSSV